MATCLKNILAFVNVPGFGFPGNTVSLPHGIRDGNDIPSVPDHVEGNTAGFVVTADATNVTVTNANPGPASISVLVELWHTVEREFGDVALLDLTPKPFIVTPAGSAGGNPINIEDEGFLVGVRPTINFIGNLVSAVDDAGNNRVDVTIASDGAGRELLPEQWAQNDVPAAQAATAMLASVSQLFDTYMAIRDGSLVGIGLRFNGNLTGGTATAEVTVNGAPTGFTIVVASGASKGQVTQAAGLNAYVAGDLIGVRLTTSAGFLPSGSLDVEASVEVDTE